MDKVRQGNAYWPMEQIKSCLTQDMSTPWTGSGQTPSYINVLVQVLKR